ncbi:hypothetical protein [Plantactinospora soyae]|uniref:Polyhydroxyalkanoate synthesis regulator phasin n=1 Tax=Plantactinospora soyae TaxID=1544732 RepID=A0A927M8H5_9ACTN|nr:hypothetical protein [Plantactinospora soyae]MBE1489012.1 polyhydroxyalkanoate synthesis regulator phasin [Plantactinospora soyae]
MPAAEVAVIGEDQAPERQSVPYRTAFEARLDFNESVARVREQIRVWLRQKRYDVERFDAGTPEIAHQVIALTASTTTAHGWQLRERRPDGVTWVSTAAVTQGKGRRQSWISLNVEPAAPPGVSLPAAAHPPRLIRLLLDAVDALDGETPLRSRAEVVAVAGVDDLLELVCAEDRRLPLVVAAAPHDVAFEDWRRDIDRLMQSLPGLASLFLLDPAAVSAFNAGIGETHWIGSASIRTYLPGVDPAIAEDALRHRVLSRRRIEAEPQRAGRVLAALPRQLAANSLPPAALRGLELSLRDFTRGTSERRASEDRLTALAEEVEMLNELLSTADDNERQMQAKLSRHTDELLDLTSDLEILRNDLERRDATIRALRQRLAALGRHADAYVPVEQPPPLPTSFSEVLDRLDSLAPFVVFTGDPAVALDLDEHPPHSNWAQLAWQALLALADYARAKRDGWSGGDFKQWCESPAEGGKAISIAKVARDESTSVRNNRRFAAERNLPVPRQIDRSGSVFMGAHIKLGTSATVSPRLHFHDASSIDQTIYVGYIGRHLSNTATSRS